MKLTLNTTLCQLLNIKYPIIQAGMAGGITSPELVANVSNAGGLGVLGAGYMPPKQLQETIHKINEKTTKPFAVNLFKVDLTKHDPRYVDVQETLNGFRDELGISPASDLVEVTDLYKDQLQVILEEHVPILSTTFGLPTKAEIDTIKQIGIKVMTMVTTVAEAKQAQEQGVDLVVAQGAEAGGHRGTFSVSNDPNDIGANVGTMALVPQIVDHVTIPVVAAGGIMDGRGLIASLALGAQGIQLGTRFLTAIESTAHPSYKRAIVTSPEDSTVITKVFSGRPARSVLNRFIKKFNASSQTPLAYPIQNMMTKDIRTKAKQMNDAGYMSLWSGQGTRMLTENQTAQEIIADVMKVATNLLSI